MKSNEVMSDAMVMTDEEIEQLVKDFCRRPADEPCEVKFDAKFSVDLSESQARKIRLLAARKHRTQSEIIRLAVCQYLDGKLDTKGGDV